MAELVKTNVVHLAFSNPTPIKDTFAFYACISCRNKTFLLDAGNKMFPMLVCSACGNEIGQVGWVEEDKK